MVPLALEAMMTEHEADRTTSLMMDAAEGRACIATGDVLARSRPRCCADCVLIHSGCGPIWTSAMG